MLDQWFDVCVLFVFHCDIGLVYYLVAVVFVFMLIYFCKWVKLNKFTKRGRDTIIQGH